MDKMTAPRLKGMKAKAERVVCLTAYDATSGAIADAAGVDLVLVGDSVGNVMLGEATTIPVGLDAMVHHTKATSKGVKRALLIADMPFGSYGSSVAQAVESAVLLMKAGAEGVKLEGPYIDEIKAITKAGIPVMGHVGFTPQSVHGFGGFKVQGRTEGGAVQKAAEEIEEAGAFAIVLELIPAGLAGQITKALSIPTIGIGAGADCDGQIQVWHDVLGLLESPMRHAKRYFEGRTHFLEAISAYSAEVRAAQFPKSEHSF